MCTSVSPKEGFALNHTILKFLIRATYHSIIANIDKLVLNSILGIQTSSPSCDDRHQLCRQTSSCDDRHDQVVLTDIKLCDRHQVLRTDITLLRQT